MHWFDRTSGVHVLAEGGTFADSVRVAPRTLLVSLLTRCNLACSFCYRDRHAPSRLTPEYLVELLEGAAAWGVLEVAFGGGEPLLFDGFAPMLRELHRRTPLALSFTTNGTLLDDRMIDELGDAYAEIRVSAYENNGYRDTLRRLRGRSVGVNWLVTPANIGMIEPHVRDFLDCGAQNILLLGYKGDDPSLQLDDTHRQQLQRTLARLGDLPIRLDVCWSSQLHDIPQLFPLADCGAGDSFLMITPDRAVKPCSFHDCKLPFETVDDLRRIWNELRANRQPTSIGGCTRSLFRAPPRETTASVRVWQGWASNHSSTYFLMGTFLSIEDRDRAVRAIRGLIRSHLKFVASEEGEAWAKDHELLGDPTPPLLEFGKRHGFEWTNDDTHTFYWESMDPPDIGEPLVFFTQDTTLYIYHPYCFQFPAEDLGRYFETLHAKDVRWAQDELPMVVRVIARPAPLDVVARLRTHVDALAAHRAEVERMQKETGDYPYGLREPPPPWGPVVKDRRFSKLESERTELHTGPYCFNEHTVEVRRGTLHLTFGFQSPFPGSVALDRWLRANGCESVDIAYEFEH